MPALRIEYYRSTSGREPVRKFLDGLPVLDRALCEQVIDYLRRTEGNRSPVRRGRDREPADRRGYVADGIWELRVTFRGVEYRILYVTQEGVSMLLHAFIKKTQETPKRELDLARHRIAEMKGGGYRDGQ